MTSHLTHQVKYLLIGLAAVAALATAPVSAYGPYMSDAGSNYYGAKVRGYNFPQSTSIYVKVYDAKNWAVLSDGWVTTDGGSGVCSVWGCPNNGSFYYAAPDTTPCSGEGRYAYAWDPYANQWYGLTDRLSCAWLVIDPGIPPL
jgi:hypothetical protein